MAFKPWIKYDYCALCGRNDISYFSNGMCSPCYFKGYNERNAERVQKYKRDWWERQGGKAYAKLKREQRYFDNVREIVLARDGSACVACGSKNKLVVHHRDGKGRNNPSPNNDIGNLETRCRRCHLKVHRSEIRAELMALYAEFWCYKWKLKACRRCGRSDRVHQSNGFCGTCARKNQREAYLLKNPEAKRVACSRGHKLTKENSVPRSDNKGVRCRTCLNARKRALRRKLKLKTV